MNKREVQQLKNLVVKELKDDADKFDIISELDNTLTAEENRRIILEKIKPFRNKLEVSKAEIKSDVLKAEQHQLQFLHKIEEEAELEFSKSLDNISRGESKELDKTFFIPKNYVKMIARGNADALIIQSRTGFGKSHLVLSTLKSEQKDFCYFNNFTSPLELFHTLFSHKDNEILVFDDVYNLLNNPTSISLLKSALFSVTGTRVINWLSTSPLLRCPKSFIFNSRIIILVNDMGVKNDDLQAVLNRTLYCKIELSWKELIKMLYAIAQQDYKGISKEERMIIADFIRDNTSEATLNLSLRTLYTCYKLYEYDKTIWKEIVGSLFEEDERVKILINIQKKYSSVNEQIKEWIEITGLGRASYFREKARI